MADLKETILMQDTVLNRKKITYEPDSPEQFVLVLASELWEVLAVSVCPSG